MSELLTKNPIALRHCLLYEFLQGKSVEQSFEDFYKTVGGDIIDKEEFEFWLDKIKRGKIKLSGKIADLNFERDENKKIYELMDLPIDIMEHVVSYLDIFDRSSLIKTSRSLRTFTRDQKTSLKSLELEVYHDRARIRFDEDAHIKYKSVGEGCKKYIRAGNRKSQNPIQGVFHWKQALLDFKSFFLNFSKLHVNILKIIFDISKKKSTIKNELAELMTELKATPHQVHCKRIIIEGNFVKSFLNILPILKPGFLRTISIRTNKTSIGGELMDMEQWKQAAYFNWHCVNITFPLHFLNHFRGFVIDLKTVSVEDVRQIKEILQKSTNLRMCVFLSLNLIDSSFIAQEFGDAVPGNPNIYHYPIPDSNEYFEIKVEMQKIAILRKKI